MTRRSFLAASAAAAGRTGKAQQTRDRGGRPPNVLHILASQCCRFAPGRNLELCTRRLGGDATARPRWSISAPAGDNLFRGHSVHSGRDAGAWEWRNYQRDVGRQEDFLVTVWAL